MVVAIKAHKIAYMAVPKAGCTSVKAGLSQCDPEVSLDIKDIADDYSLVHKNYPTMRFRPHRWREYEGWWRFTVVRDPAKRLMSVYSDMVVGRQFMRNSPKLRQPDASLPIDPDPDFFYQNLPEYMAQSSVIKHHALPVWLFIGPTPHQYDRIYRIEDIPALTTDLTERVGSEMTIPRFNKTSASLKFSDLNAKTRASLDDYLKTEYATLAGIYDPQH